MRDVQIDFCSVTVDSFKVKSQASRGMYYSLCELSMFLRMVLSGKKKSFTNSTMPTTIFAGGEWLHNGHHLQHAYNLLGCLSCKTLVRVEIIPSVFWCTSGYWEIRSAMVFQPLLLVTSIHVKHYRTTLAFVKGDWMRSSMFFSCNYHSLGFVLSKAKVLVMLGAGGFCANQKGSHCVNN